MSKSRRQSSTSFPSTGFPEDHHDDHDNFNDRDNTNDNVDVNDDVDDDIFVHQLTNDYDEYPGHDDNHDHYGCHDYDCQMWMIKI